MSRAVQLWVQAASQRSLACCGAVISEQQLAGSLLGERGGGGASHRRDRPPLVVRPVAACRQGIKTSTRALVAALEAAGGQVSPCCVQAGQHPDESATNSACRPAPLACLSCRCRAAQARPRPSLPAACRLCPALLLGARWQSQGRPAGRSRPAPQHWALVPPAPGCEQPPAGSCSPAAGLPATPWPAWLWVEVVGECERKVVALGFRASKEQCKKTNRKRGAASNGAGREGALENATPISPLF